MTFLENDRIFLRALEKRDAFKLTLWENNTEFWHVSDTEVPFSLHTMEQFVEQNTNFRSTGQLRLMMVEKSSNEEIGCIDLFDGNTKHRRAALGILIAKNEHRGKGYAQDGLLLTLDYAQAVLDLHQIYAHIDEANSNSIKLFENAGFEQSGKLLDWRRWNKSWHNILVYQKILNRNED